MAPPAPEVQDGAREVMIEVDRLTRYYGVVPALNDVSFHAYRGEIVGFLGPNGAGKTTAMRILTGFLPPSSGTARVAGHDVVEDSLRARRATGYLPENSPLYHDMTVYGYLDFMSKLRHVPARADAIERVMARVSIDDRADDLIGQLSKGLRQRVGIAQALVHDPEVIILDEPTIGLDPHQIKEVRGLIRELGGDHTIILSTHILPEAEQICDRVLIINRGEIVEEDAVERLAQSARHGGEQVRVAVAAPADLALVRAALEALPEVREVEARGDGEFLLSLHREVVGRAAVAETIVQRGWQLLELTPVRVTLEDIFLAATGPRAEADWTDEAQSPAPGAATEAPVTEEAAGADDAAATDETTAAAAEEV